jgi:ribonuclease P protein component
MTVGMLLGEAKLRHACGKVNLDRNRLGRLTLRAHWGTRISYAADISPAQSQADQSPRFPCPDGGSLGSRGAFSPSQEGPQAAHRPAAFETRRTLTAAERLPRTSRLTLTSELRRVQETGKRRRLAHLDVLWADNQAGHPRVGLIVPKFQSSAVARNRLRRRLREVWRRELQRDLPPWDVVIRARRDAYGAEFEALSSQLLTWRMGVG